MTEGELRKLADEANDLSELARETLLTELRGRGLEVELRASAPGPRLGPPPIILRKFCYWLDALVAKSILDSADIECYLIDENIVRMDWFYSNAVGGIKLIVRPGDRDDAAALLDQDYLEEFYVEGVGLYKQPRCPNCGSFSVCYQPLMKRLAYASFFFFPLLFWVALFAKHVAWMCRSCRHAWEDTEEK